jgi:hypothetical protein
MRRFVVSLVALFVITGAGGVLLSTAAADPGHLFSIANDGVIEGSGALPQIASMTVTVNEPPEVGEEIEVDWATSDAPPSTATSSSGTSTGEYPEDYVRSSGTVRFHATETTHTIDIPIVQDTADEAATETFFVNLFNPQSVLCTGICSSSTVAIDDGQGVFTITDDDDVPTISINDVTHDEGNTGTTAYIFTVTRTGGSAQSVTVDYATANDTATQPSDYTAANGTVTFPASEGNSTATLTVNANGDTTNEATERFFVNLTNPVNATVSDAQGNGTITNDDPAPPPTVSIGDASVTEGGSLVFDVTLSAPPGLNQTATVNFDTSPPSGSATSGSDYTATAGSITFGAGESVRTATVPTSQDSLDEPNETMTVQLSKPTSCCSGGYNYDIGDGTGQGTINDDDDAVATLTIDDVTVTEGDLGTVDATFTVTKTGVTAQSVTVAYATADDTATAGTDYASTDGLLTFAPGETTKLVTVQVLGDTADEANETFFVDLSGATNASITDAQGLGTITDDDAVTLAINDVTVAEGDSGTSLATFTVTKSDTNGQTATVTYGSADDTATTADNDYESSSGVLTFLDSEFTKTIAVTVNGDEIDEATERFFMELTAPTNAVVSDGHGIGTITNDDAPEVVSDFDGDGFSDAAFGAPGEDLGSKSNAGAVHVIYGTSNGLSSGGSQLWHLDVTGVPEVAAANDRFGSALSVGDFDNDGSYDLAIGIPGRTGGSGSTLVLYGTASGLSATGSQTWSQASTDILGNSEPADMFGAALDSGDYNGDAISDLAIGAPGEDGSSGAVNVLHGSEAGLTATNNQAWNQGTAEAGDVFGSALGSGDIDADGHDDLVVGARGEDVGSVTDAGAATVLYGSAAGLTAVGSHPVDQNTADVEDASETDDAFGASIAVGDLDGDGNADVAFGAPGEGIGAKTLAGAVNVLYGTESGLSATGDQLWSQDSTNVDGTSETGDAFGFSVAAGDLDDDGFDDLAIGARREDLGSVGNAGASSVLYGTAEGLSGTNSQLWTQGSTGIAGNPEQGDQFASALAFSDFNGDSMADAVFGVPSEDVGSATNTGVANVVYGSAAGLSSAGNQQWYQDVEGIAGSTESGDAFATAVR